VFIEKSAGDHPRLMPTVAQPGAPAAVEQGIRRPEIVSTSKTELSALRAFLLVPR